MQSLLCNIPIDHQDNWPSEVRLITSVLEQQESLFENRRSMTRYPYRVKAGIEIIEGSGMHPSRSVQVYTRDANARGLGFVSNRELSLGVKARLHLPSPADRPRWIACSIVRCRSFIDGWFEGAVLFDNDQRMFEPGDAD
ncbi:MAG TPA: hypothetical protein VHD56_02015 [Tepidisphaeraceae bacterium]|nr:hypothetical protein [Tepidisphaeraceae bacterium]